jgi:hypothetical protein
MIKELEKKIGCKIEEKKDGSIVMHVDYRSNNGYNVKFVSIKEFKKYARNFVK